jgi:uncharacterized protein
MPEYLSPGVYVEEVASGPRPIEGVSTSTAGMVGLAERGPTRARLVTSWEDYKRWFGDVVEPSVSYAPFAARAFFTNSGQRLFFARVVRNDAVTASLDVPTASAAQAVTVEASGPGGWGNRIFFRLQAGTLDDPAIADKRLVRVTVLYYREAPPLPFVDPTDRDNIADPNRREPDVVEDYDNLGVLPTQPDHFMNKVTAHSQLIEVRWGDDNEAPALPTPTAGFVQLDTVAGDDGAAAFVPDDFRGDSSVAPDQRVGLAALEGIDQISILCAPDADNALAIPAVATRQAITNALVNQCELTRDRFAVLSLPAGVGDVSDATFSNTRDTSYAAVYYPWVRVIDNQTGLSYLVPPVGHVAGIYARSDVNRGVHKAPANEVVRDISGDINATRKPLEFLFGKREQDILNPLGVNVIRDFRGDRRDIRVWGARTLSTDPLLRYINVRRLLLFIEESIDEGTQWVVFEPNDEPLWARVRASVRNFLLLVWRSGALQGLREEDAFFVKCDRSTMTQADVDAGRLICRIGVAPVKPAEFVIFRISQFAAGNNN